VSAIKAETFVDLGAAARAKSEASAAAARLERTRREREELEAASRKSLGEQLLGSKVSAAEWVAQSRKRTLLETAREELAARGLAAGAAAPAAAAAASAPTSAAPMLPRAGIRIAHSTEAFEALGTAEEPMVLTLKDSALLNEAGEGLGEEEDQLVHAGLMDKQRISEDLARRKRGAACRPGAYAYEEDAEAGSEGKALLPQYDEPPKQQASTGLVIGEHGIVQPEGGGAPAPAAHFKAPLRASHRGTTRQRGESVDGEGEEARGAPTLAPPTAAASSSSLGLGSTVPSSAGILAELERQRHGEGGAGGASRDRGSRAARNAAGGGQFTSAAAAADAAAQARGAAAFSEALQRAQGGGGAGSNSSSGNASFSESNIALVLAATKAAEAAAAASSSTTGQHRIYTRLLAVGGGEDEEDADDSSLQSLLMRARAQKAVQQRQGGEVGGDEAARVVAQQLLSRQNGVGAGMGGAGEAGGGVVFTATTDFSRLLEARKDPEGGSGASMQVHPPSAAPAAAAAAAAAAASKGAPDGAGSEGAAAVAAGASAGVKRKRDEKAADKPSVPKWKEDAAQASKEEDMGASWVDLDKEGVGGGEDEEDEEEDEEDEDEEEGEGGDFRDVLSGRRSFTGVAGALSLLSEAGDISGKRKLSGRANDARPDTRADAREADAAGLPHVQLDYRDEEGRELTPKEAYRRISYAFHGHMPSKTTREKRLKRMLKEQKMAQGGSVDAVNNSLHAQQRLLEGRGQAFLHLGK
jgi:hypothetical protein